MGMHDQRYEAMLERLRELGLRLTPQRLAILRVLAESLGHPSVEDIHAAILKDYPTTSLATVYKTVHLLKEAGEVLELEFSDLANRYDGNKPYPHPHVICRGCGAIAEPMDCGAVALADKVAEQTGFTVLSHRLDFYGLCPRCRKG